MRINTNVASLNAREANMNTQKHLNNSLEKLSSGLRINKASDDASGLSIADKLRTQASSIGQSILNGNSAVALTQIADKAMAEQSNILDIIKTKLLQAATATTSSAGRDAISKDVSKLFSQLNNIAIQTNYNGIQLLQVANTVDAGSALAHGIDTIPEGYEASYMPYMYMSSNEIKSHETTTSLICGTRLWILLLLIIRWSIIQGWRGPWHTNPIRRRRRLQAPSTIHLLLLLSHWISTRHRTTRIPSRCLSHVRICCTSIRSPSRRRLNIQRRWYTVRRRPWLFRSTYCHCRCSLAIRSLLLLLNHPLDLFHLQPSHTKLLLHLFRRQLHQECPINSILSTCSQNRRILWQPNLTNESSNNLVHSPGLYLRHDVFYDRLIVQDTVCKIKNQLILDYRPYAGYYGVHGFLQKMRMARTAL